MDKTIRTVFIAIFILFLMPIQALAVNVGYFGTTGESTKFLWADSKYGDDYFTRVDYVSRGSNTIKWYKKVGTKATYVSSSTVSGTGSITPPGNISALKLKSNSGKEIYLTYAETTNPNSRKLYFESGGGSDTGGDSGGGSDGGSGNCGCIFNTPGWQKYMGKMNDVIKAIPPAPNWSKVAGTFRDKIAPRIKSDMSNLLGRAPNLPKSPGRAPGVNDGNLKKPQGKVAPGLDGFNKRDIEKEAPKIKERDDPTGGWDILNPIENLPSQDEFKKNKPDEGEVKLPDVPPVDAETPGEPKEQENKPPKPPEQDNPAPGAPEEQENKAPTPPKQDNPAPGAPKEQENKAPVPNEDTGEAPKPDENMGDYPYPGRETGKAPLPGDSGTKAPMPSRDNSKAPIP